MGLRLPHIHIAKILQRPQQIPLGQGAPVLSPAAQDRQRGEAGCFHLLQRLTDGVIVIYIGTHGLRCEEKQDIVHHWLPSMRYTGQWTSLPTGIIS